MTTKNTLAGVVLNVQSPKNLAQFYTQYFGLSVIKIQDELRLSYGKQGAYLALRQAPSSTPYQMTPTDQYWKIGITLPDLDLAYQQLNDKGINISEPQQFRDIGYLCHVTDPEGFTIELLQHTFEEAPLAKPGDPEKPLGGGAKIGQITLRTTNIKQELSYYQQQLGMRLLSIQPVTVYGFTLYFLAFTQEVPPDPDLQAVSNRPWLWQRPYTTLEIQHLLSPGATIQQTPPDQAGFSHLRFTV